MSGRLHHLLDTNILVHAHTSLSSQKSERARDLLARLGRGGQSAVSVQSLSEFSRIMMKLGAPLADIRLYKSRIERAFSALLVTEFVVDEALRGVEKYKLPFYDAHIWAVARMNQIPRLLTEDFAIGTVLDGVEFINPLASSEPTTK